MYNRSPPLSKVAQQSSFQSLATPSVSATELWSEEPLEKRNLQKEDEKESAKKGWKQEVNGRGKKKKRKMRNERNEALISYLIRRSAPPSPFH